MKFAVFRFFATFGLVQHKNKSHAPRRIKTDFIWGRYA